MAAKGPNTSYNTWTTSDFLGKCSAGYSVCAGADWTHAHSVNAVAMATTTDFLWQHFAGLKYVQVD